jgi:hypothetical protein
MIEDMRRGRITRRKAILGILLLGGLVEAVLAVAVFASGGDTKGPGMALPLHPVAGNFKVDDTKLENCDGQRCTEQAFGNIAYLHGPKVALTRFKARYGDFSDPGCHRVAHAIGSATLARNKGDVARTFAQGWSDCFSGYYHGVLERSLLSVKSYDPETLGRVARELCGDIATSTSLWLTFQCLHGLGHGLMITTGYSLPLSLKVCDRLSTSWETRSCNGGVFMENISTMYGVQSRWVRDDDPVYPCTSVAQEDKVKCYELVTSRILRLNGASWEKTAETCAAVERDWVAACFRSLGRDSAGQAHEDPAMIRELCVAARAYSREGDCIEGAARAMVGNFGNGRRASQLCATTELQLRDQCYYGVGGATAIHGPSAAKRESGCRSLTTDARYVAQCIRGGNAFLRLVHSK